MIRFKTMRFKNILSFGNQWTTIDFQSHKNILIQGKNGSGKSACILDTLSFVLYGKPFRKINKPILVNYKNKKDMVVEIVFSADNGDTYKVIRGQAPALFSIYCNDTLVNQDAQSRDYQKYLEKEVLKIDFQAFTQIVILGKATYVAFLRLQLGDRRKFIESVLNLSIFSMMGEITNRNISQTKNEIQTVKNDLNVLNARISITKNHLSDFEKEAAQIREDREKKISAQIESIEKEIDNLNYEIEMRMAQLTEISQSLSGIRSKQVSLTEIHTRLSVKNNQTKNKIDFFEKNEVCLTCDALINDDFRDSKIRELSKKHEEIENAQTDIMKRLSDIIQTMELVEESIRKNQEIERECTLKKSLVRQKENTIQSLRESNIGDITSTVNNIQSIRDTLIQTQKEYSKKVDERTSLAKQFQCLEIVQMMTKDAGIKASIIRDHIPSIVGLMNANLKKLGLFLRFELNENFEEKLYARGFEEIPYHALSEGEKQRTDIALVMTWRDICKMQNNMSVDLIVFDEILDGSLDESGTESLIELFKSLSSEGTRVIVISHSSEKWDQFFNVSYNVEMKGGFSFLKERIADA